MYNLSILHIEIVGGGVFKPGACVVDMALAVVPVSGSMEVAQYHYLGFREELFGKAISQASASEPAANDVERALRGPEAV